MEKLVRDKIPEIVKEEGRKAETRIAEEREFKELLKEKLKEEVNEFLESEEIEELADILEVVYALSESLGIKKEELEEIREKKAKKRGKFEKRIVMKI